MIEKTEKSINHKTCNDCIHFDVCNEKYRIATHDYMAMDSRPTFNEKCLHHFKDKSRYIELPCAVGDTVYRINGSRIEKFKVARFIISSYGKRVEDLYGVQVAFIDDFGKTIFLTKKDAERVLHTRISKKLDYVEAKYLDKDSPEFKEAVESLNRL